VPKSHDLAVLSGLLGEASPIPKDLAAGLAGLSGWVVSGRYPDPPKGLDAPDSPNVQAALALIARLDAIVAEALGEAG